MAIAKNLDFAKLYRADNVRTDGCKLIPQMVESLRRSGFKENHPIVVSTKPDDSFLVLCGNRRTEALQWLRDNDPTAFNRILVSGKVPCIIHKNLTAEEEVLLRIDHSTEEDRVPLDEWSIYTAIQQMVRVGFDTQEKIAEKLGIFVKSGKKKGQPNRSFVQPRVNLARLPGFVADELRKRNDDRKSTPLRWEHIPALFTTYQEEFSEYPNPEKLGPKFSELWASITNPAPAQPTGTREKPLSVSDAKKRAMSASSTCLRNAMLCVTGQGKGLDFAVLDNNMVQAETAYHTLANIKAYLGDEKYGQLLQDAAEFAAMQAEPATA